MTPVHFIDEAVRHLGAGGVIAYATESVFGLGCDPDDQSAVERLLSIKQRPVDKGLILVAANLQQLEPYLDLSVVSQSRMAEILASWPGPNTWVMPASSKAAPWITGKFDSIAVRVSAHPQVQQLCLCWGKPLVSTSANLSGENPCRTEADVRSSLGEHLDYVLPGQVGGAVNPSQIRDALTGHILRPA
ncbi:Sua5/YciO/YrdC/YwlC family protein [Pseudaeromonas sharmana]|uniref:Threonylcarbamoyl-AMP synthase n=1 Tax=Pseudaeromonas sharmana TaxID=328412 RepID=A0ABV8CNE1_9GAMM